MAVQQIALAQERRQHGRGHLARALSRLRRKKLAIAAIIALVIVYSAGIFAPLIAPYGYRDQDISVVRQAPSLQHWAGTDGAGRDVLTRVLWAVQNTIIITVISMVTGGLLIGITLGLVAGYFGGMIDSIINRVGEVFSAVPDILLMIILAATLKQPLVDLSHWVEDHSFLDGLVRTGIPDYTVIAIVLVIISWFGMQRLVRGQVLVLKETQHVEAARAVGASTPRILFRHLLPNAISPIVVTVSLGMGSMIGFEIILSWLGLGIQPPRPSLGTMLLEYGSLPALREVPWLLLAPGLVAWTLVLAWNLLGDQLNDVLNPRTR